MTDPFTDTPIDLLDHDAVAARVDHLLTLGRAYLAEGAGTFAGHKFDQAAVLSRRHAWAMNRAFARAFREVEERVTMSPKEFKSALSAVETLLAAKDACHAPRR